MRAFVHTESRNASAGRRGLVPGRRGVLLAALLLGLTVQIAVVANRDFAADDSPATPIPMAQPAPLALGDTVLPLAGTVVYAFSAQCEHSNALGPAWAKHFGEAATTRSSFRRTAVTSEDPETAVLYSKRYGWNVEVLGTAELALDGRELSLVDRTPWLFVFDSAGVLRYEGHGAELDRLEEVLRSIAG